MAVPEQHRASGPTCVACGIVTVSDSRTAETDDSGRTIRDLLEHAGHSVGFYAVVRDDADAIADAVDLATRTCAVVITNGGTGLTRRDVTIATLAPRFEKALPGFGELFRALSFREVGSAAMLSGAIAGVYRGRVVFCLPGSPDACRLAVEALILPELGHIAGMIHR